MSARLHLHDYEPATDNLLDEVVEGLLQPQKQLPSKLFYDERGSKLFERITALEEYYPTRTESEITRRHVAQMAQIIGPRPVLIELGSGSSEKTRILLDHLDDPVAYVPIDISKDHLLASASEIANTYPSLEVHPVCADYEQPFELPQTRRSVGRNVVYFPGSTIGNFHPDDAVTFLGRLATLGGERASLLIGVDLKKDPAILNAAYNDAEGVTALFNLNILVHINRALGADFDTAKFHHRAFFNEAEGRIEMHLVSAADQTVCVGDEAIPIKNGETIWTESSYKYTVDEFAALAARAGYNLKHAWLDDAKLFSVQLYSWGPGPSTQPTKPAVSGTPTIS